MAEVEKNIDPKNKSPLLGTVEKVKLERGGEDSEKGAEEKSGKR